MKISPEGIKRHVNEDFLKHVIDNITVSKDPLIYHYASVTALYDGIIVKNPEENKEICLRASNCAYMNDPQEVREGRSFVDKITGFKSTLKESKENEEFFKEMFYLISFTSKKDFLPMWSMYGKDGTGITLGFDRKILSEIYEDRFFKCIYMNKHILKEFKHKFSSSYNNNSPILSKENAYGKLAETMIGGFIDVLQGVVACLYLIFLTKNSAYEYEQEVRFIELISDKTNTKYRHSNNLLIPYQEISFPKSALKEICIGPMLDSKRVEKSIKAFLEANNFNSADIKIVKSKVPYRGK